MCVCVYVCTSCMHMVYTPMLTHVEARCQCLLSSLNTLYLIL